MKKFLFIVAIIASKIICAQNGDIKLGKVSLADFTAKYDVDTTTGAIVLSDIGKTYFEGNNKEWFSVMHEHHRRVKILDKKAIDMATVEIPLYIDAANRQEEKIESLKAYYLLH